MGGDPLGRTERQAEGIAAAKRREAEGRLLPGKKRTGRSRTVGTEEEFAAYLAALRAGQKRKRNLMGILDQHGL